MNRVMKAVAGFGWPRLLILAFLLALFAAAPFVGVRLDESLTDVLNRFGQNAVMVLALLPMVQAGCGLNFGLPVGIIAGLLGSTIAMQAGGSGFPGFLLALAITLPIGALFGAGYGAVLNKIKGEEMTIAMYVGFSAVMLFSILWLVLPFTRPDMVMAFAGEGLRRYISLEGYWAGVLNRFLAVRIGPKFVFPTGLIAFVALAALAIKVFMLSKTGTALTAVGSNPAFARATGVSVNKMRLVSVAISTALGGVGILVYQQSFGAIQVYDAPLFMAFPAVSALLLGGASVNKASVFNVVVGTLLFQGILTMTPSVFNAVLKTDMSEVIRIIVSNGMIIYALTRKTGSDE